VISIPNREIAMKIAECMTPDVRFAGPGDTIQQAAQTMAETDCGILPVRDGDRLVGMLTDRDIAIRAVAQGRGPDLKVKDVMSDEVLYCFEDEDVADVLRNMGDIKVRRLPVLNRDKRLVGIIALGDIATKAGRKKAAQALGGVSEPL
jgi:CBS domain-containing protein